MSKYIPTQDSEFKSFVSEFVQYSQNNSSQLQLPAELTAVLAASLQTFNQVLSEHQSLETNLRVAKASKKAARQELEKWVTEARDRIGNSNLVEETHLSALKIAPRKSRVAPGPINSRPIISVDFTKKLQHTLSFSDENTPSSRRKPAGAIALELWIKKGGPAPTSIDDCVFYGVIGQYQETVSFFTAEAGLTAHYLGRWVARKGNKKTPVSDVVSSMVVG